MSYYDDRSMVDGPDLGYTNPRVVMIRRIKGVILIILLILMIILMYIQYNAKMDDFEGSHYKPILPIGAVLFPLLLMAFIMAIVGIVFKLVEVKASETGSQKYLLGHSSMKAALSSMIIAIVLAIVIFIIPTLPAAQDILNSNDVGNAEYGNQTYSFNAQDEFLISETTAIEYDVTNGVEVNSSLFPKNEYDEGNLDSEISDANSRIKYPDGTDQYKYEEDLDYGKYTLVIENDNTQTAKVDYTVHRKVKDSLLNTLLTFAIMFAVLEGIWLGVTMGIKQKFKSDSIYQ